MGSREGILKIAANRLGVSLEVYLERLADGLKWCRKCRTWHSRVMFNRDRSRGDGYNPICRACLLRPTKGPPPAERRRQRGRGKAWCRDCGKWLPLSEVRGGLCRPHINQRDRERYATDARYRAERKQHAHARKRNIEPLPVVGQEHLLSRFKGRCAYCGRRATTWDHIFPVTCGGNSTPGNVVPACRTCNSSKGDRDVFDWMVEKGIVPSDELVEQLILAECGLYP